LEKSFLFCFVLFVFEVFGQQKPLSSSLLLPFLFSSDFEFFNNFLMTNNKPKGHEVNKKWRKDHSLKIGAAAIINGEKEVAKTLLLSRQFVQYWSKKFSDPNFHPKSQGGRRF
jgi:hypothetical protein